MKDSIKKLDYIDTLRGAAVLGVLMIHSSLNAHLPGVFGSIVGEGQRGVQLFFIASAFTLFLSLKNRADSEISPIRNFFIRRFFRIAPMYYLGIIYYIFQDGLGPRYWLGDADHISSANILSNITFLHGFNPYYITSLVPGGWSIAVEMTFYAVLPFLFARIKNINQAFNFFLISITVRAVLEYFLSKHILISSASLWTEYLDFYFPSQLPIFALGILMYFIIENKENGIIKLPGKSLLLFGCLIIIQFGTSINFILANHILFGFSFLLIGIALSRYKPILLVNPIINYIGKISFSMYLVHFAVLHWLVYFNFINYFNDEIVNYLIRFYLVIFLSVLISSITYYWIEKPFQKIGSKLISRLEENPKGAIL